MAQMINTPRILNKFYIYDPNVSDTFGGLRVLQEKDDKGNVKEGTNHVLAVTQQMQYWIDQGLAGDKPVGEISATHKKLLAQITRGRSEDNDKRPGRIPKYDKRIQSGAPKFAGSPGYPQGRKTRSHKGKKQEPFTSTNPDNPQAQAKNDTNPSSPATKRVPPTTPPR
jgi:hypothetical protein